jgi:hypothetical protein
MKEGKIHLRGFGYTLCGKRTSFLGGPKVIGIFKFVTCKNCMKTEEYKKYLNGKYSEKPTI